MRSMKGKILIVLLVSCAAGVGSFYVTRTIEEEKSIVPDRTVKQWLDLSEQQHQSLQQSVTEFNFTAANLAYDYQNERQKLVQFLNDSQSTDQQILDQIDNVILTNDQLFREVVGYVLSMRQQLTPQQHQRLMQLCNKVIEGQIDKQFFQGRNARFGNRQSRRSQRGPGLGPGQGRGMGPGQTIIPGQGMGPGRIGGQGQGMRRGQGQGQGLGGNQGIGRGQGQNQRIGIGEGMGRGQGMGNQGMGRGSRGQANRQGQGRGQNRMLDQTAPRGQGNRSRGRGRGNFARRLNFDTSQIQLTIQLDPEFEQQSFELSSSLRDYYHQLALLLEDPNTSEEAVWEHLENLFELRNQLDRRIAEHVLLMRPHLTPQQLKTLISMSSR